MATGWESSEFEGWPILFLLVYIGIWHLMMKLMDSPYTYIGDTHERTKEKCKKVISNIYVEHVQTGVSQILDTHDRSHYLLISNQI